MASTLKESDLGELVSKYSKHQVKWYEIGLQLGIEDRFLDAIRVNFPRVEERFCKMLAHWLINDDSATEDRLQKAKKDAECCPKWYLTLIGVTVPIIGVMLLVYYQHANSPLTAAAQTLKTEYRAHDVVAFNLLNISDVEYLGVVMKDKDGHEFGYSELMQNYSGKGGRLIITGLPGSGKSTLLRQLAREWANGRVLSNCQILFLIYLGSLEEKVKSLGDLLSKSEFGDTANLKEVSEKIYATNGAGACFLFDAYDELKWNEYEFIDKIMEGSKIQSSFCLLTSRPFHEEKFQKQTQFEILGYNVDTLPNYLNKLSNNATLVGAIQDLWDSNPKVKEMCTLPLHMAMMLYIYSYESAVSIRTLTQLYIAFMNVTIKHYELERRHQWNTESLWQCILAKGPSGDDLCFAFNVLHQIAYAMSFKAQVLFQDNISNDVIKDLINQLSFMGVISVPGSKSQVKFSFSHPTFLEFFAALHLTTLPLNQQQAYIIANPYLHWTKYDIHTGMIFYIGLIGDRFHYNPLGASSVFKQFFLGSPYDPKRPFPDLNLCNKYKRIEEAIGWTKQQYEKVIDSILNANYSMCTSCAHGFPMEDVKYYSVLIQQGHNKMALYIMLWGTRHTDYYDPVIVTHTSCLTEQDQFHLISCVQGLQSNQDPNNCHGLKLSSVTSLTIHFSPNVDTLYTLKRALPNMKYLNISLWIYGPNWNEQLHITDWNIILLRRNIKFLPDSKGSSTRNDFIGSVESKEEPLSRHLY